MHVNICVIGSGYVGLVTGACFADLGNSVICVDSDASKIKKLKAGVMPFFEPGLDELVTRNARKKRLSFTTKIADSVRRSDVIFIAVSTPPKPNGEADLRFVESVSKSIALSMRSYKLIVEKSTVPVNSGEWIEHTVNVFNERGIEFDVASNPEFLRESTAIEDFMRPDRIVLGVKSKKARDLLVELYRPIKAPVIITDIKAAELIKHASNSFLAMKISFINAIANICDKVGADVTEVAKGMGFDGRIGPTFLNAGIGFGGSCFPKDVAAFIRIAERCGYDFSLLKEVQKINIEQRAVLLKKIEDAIWTFSDKTVGVLGLSFKPDTDDMRNAPSLAIIESLLQHGTAVKVYDPAAMEKAKPLLKGRVKFCRNAYEAAKDSDCLVVVTEWNEFKELDFRKIRKLMRQPVIVDGRNIYDPADIKQLKFKYVGMGRK